MKKNIVIIGAGFGGIAAAKYLAKNKKELKDYAIHLIDKKKNYEFIPMLPDLIAGWLEPEAISLNLEKFSQKKGINFVCDSVQKIDREKKKIITKNREIAYQYLIIAAGSKTNFFANTELSLNCRKLDSVKDALKIKNDLLDKAQQKKINIVVVGGGYTGLEIATNAHFLLTKNKLPFSITVVEKAPEILKMVSDRIKQIAKSELNRLGIKVITGDSLQKYKGEHAQLESGRKIKNAFCIWSAGVETSDFIQNLEAKKDKGRLLVDQNLNLKGKNEKRVFVAGDSAAFATQAGKSLRMAIMFAIGQGKIAAKNIINSLQGKKISSYQPIDLGYLIPLTYKKAPGIVIGAPVGPKLGYFLHYYMCFYRSEFSKKSKVWNAVRRRLRP
ncbi:MAG: FAD-dependent oxidoreductase [Candidatus Omnitrophica bacterium]|nr:FAD-dependent oxidoreductase [Candidatus Omnitrophota bacterium]MCF7898133.1 FAD-dependent oxidoreductase [Candidatus Omnitrophota bacterium]